MADDSCIREWLVADLAMDQDSGSIKVCSLGISSYAIGKWPNLVLDLFPHVNNESSNPSL